MTSHHKSIVLMPGELYFGDHTSTIRTLLGSCVSIVLWHPQKRIGGMCHYVLPSRQQRGAQGERYNPDNRSTFDTRFDLETRFTLDARYADEALELMLMHIKSRHTRAEQFQARLYGGANMFQSGHRKGTANSCMPLKSCDECKSVACMNQNVGLMLVKRTGFTLAETDLGGNSHRLVEFHVGTGNVHIKRGNQQMIRTKVQGSS